MDVGQSSTEPTRPRRRRAIVTIVVGLLGTWLILAYVVLPWLWKDYALHHPALDDNPRITQTSDHHPGDPLNVALIGTQEQLQELMKAADWSQAEALGLRSDLAIAADSLLSRPDDAAPVSNLFLLGRREDLAFEQPVGDNPRHRHHVRFWKTLDQSDDKRPIWIGSAVFDTRVGLSRTTGQITHVTDANVDAERDYLFDCLEKSGRLDEHYVIKGYHSQLHGRNGGGDPWQTDGSLYVGIIRATP